MCSLMRGTFDEETPENDDVIYLSRSGTASIPASLTVTVSLDITHSYCLVLGYVMYQSHIRMSLNTKIIVKHYNLI